MPNFILQLVSAIISWLVLLSVIHLPQATAEVYTNSKYHSTAIKKSVSIVAVLRTSKEIKMFLF